MSLVLVQYETDFESLGTNSSNTSVGVCDALDFTDVSDRLDLYIELHVPADASIGTKVLYINYEAIALG